MKSALIGLLACLFVLSAQGQQADRSNKCRCSKSLLIRINPKLIKGEPVIHFPSIFCPRTEIIITTKDHKEKCVDPESTFGQIILVKKNKHKKTGAADMTTASAQTSTSNSARRHTASTRGSGPNPTEKKWNPAEGSGRLFH